MLISCSVGNLNDDSLWRGMDIDSLKLRLLVSQPWFADFDTSYFVVADYYPEIKEHDTWFEFRDYGRLHCTNYWDTATNTMMGTNYYDGNGGISLQKWELKKAEQDTLIVHYERFFRGPISDPEEPGDKGGALDSYSEPFVINKFLVIELSKTKLTLGTIKGDQITDTLKFITPKEFDQRTISLFSKLAGALPTRSLSKKGMLYYHNRKLYTGKAIYIGPGPYFFVWELFEGKRHGHWIEYVSDTLGRLWRKDNYYENGELLEIIQSID